MSRDNNLYDEDEGARPSSLQPVHKLSTPDPLYDQQLLRELAIINERMRKELGPRPRDGAPAKVGRKNITDSDSNNLTGGSTPPRCVVSLEKSKAGVAESNQAEENETMKLNNVAMAAALGAATLGGADAKQREGESRNANLVHAEAKIPPGFHVYTSVVVGEAGTCVVGAASNENSMSRLPYVYLSDANAGHVRWVKALEIPKEFYEGRATHCVRKGNYLYALVQLETHSQRSLSQTVLHVVKLRLVDGSVLGDLEILVPGVDGVYSSWVKKGGDKFQQVNDEVMVIGEYRYLDSEDDLPFSATVKL